MIRPDGRPSTGLGQHSYSSADAQPEQGSAPAPATAPLHQVSTDGLSTTASPAAPDLGQHTGSAAEESNLEALRPRQRPQQAGFSLRGAPLEGRRLSGSDQEERKTSYN